MPISDWSADVCSSDLSDDRECPSSVADQPWQSGYIVGHQRDIRGLDGSIAADGAHGDAEAGAGQCRSIVDSIANHGHGAVSRFQLLDDLQLVFGEDRKSTRLNSSH